MSDTPTPAPEAAPAAAPAPPPPDSAKSLYLATADVFDRLAGAVWSLTPDQAAQGGNALQPVPDPPEERAFILAAWGRAPLVRS